MRIFNNISYLDWISCWCTVWSLCTINKEQSDEDRWKELLLFSLSLLNNDKVQTKEKKERKEYVFQFYVMPQMGMNSFWFWLRDCFVVCRKWPIKSRWIEWFICEHVIWSRQTLINWVQRRADSKYPYW